MQPTDALRLQRLAPVKRPAAERARDFDEIDHGLSPAQAMIEAQRCVQCSNPPCAEIGCPLGNQIPRWIDQVVDGRFEQAARILAETSTMPEMCGKLCPHESLCESRCVVGQVSRPVSIGRLEEAVSRLAEQHDWYRSPKVEPTGKRVAIIGSGPAGLSAASRLLDLGHAVVIFERLPVPGGVPVYGIPKFKYAKERVAALVERIRDHGAEIRCGVSIGSDLSIDDLLGREKFNAVVLAIGAPRGRAVDIPGVELANIHMATDFLLNANLPADQLLPEDRMTIEVGKTCAVIGGGDTGADCVRSAVRLGFETVICIYRRSQDEMPGRKEDRGYAEEEGVRYEFLANPVRYEGRGKVERVACIRMQLGDADESGRRRPVPIEGSEFSVEADTVVLALGYQIDTELITAMGCDLESGALRVDSTLATSRAGVFAAGDVVNGADLIVTAARDGRDVAMAVNRFLKKT